jgi:hypothetical protein
VQTIVNQGELCYELKKIIKNNVKTKQAAVTAKSYSKQELNREF